MRAKQRRARIDPQRRKSVGRVVSAQGDRNGTNGGWKELEGAFPRFIKEFGLY